MSDSKKITLGMFSWIFLITGMHLGLNMNWSVVLNDRLPAAMRRLYVAYIPVT